MKDIDQRIEKRQQDEHVALGEELCQRYAHRIDELSAADDPLPTRMVLACLLLRDAIARWIDEAGIQHKFEVVCKIVKNDRMLRGLESRIAAVDEIAVYRRSRTPKPDAWWWFPKERLQRKSNAWSLLFSACTVALLLELGRRFGSGGPSLVGAALVLLPAVLTALFAGGAISKGIRLQLDELPRPFASPFSRSIVLFTLVLGIWNLSPILSKFYNNWGYDEFEAGRLALAEAQLQRATRLDPNNGEAHYNLAVLFEDQLRNDEAIHEYQVAWALGVEVAANNLGRLLILKGLAEAAAQILLPLEEETRSGTVDDITRYRILKNLAWARIHQVRSADALVYLEEAVALVPEAAPAHCLLGSVHSERGDLASARHAWSECLAKARRLDPDEDSWIGQASIFFKENSK